MRPWARPTTDYDSKYIGLRLLLLGLAAYCLMVLLWWPERHRHKTNGRRSKDKREQAPAMLLAALPGVNVRPDGYRGYFLGNHATEVFSKVRYDLNTLPNTPPSVVGAEPQLGTGTRQYLFNFGYAHSKIPRVPLCPIGHTLATGHPVPPNVAV